MVIKTKLLISKTVWAKKLNFDVTSTIGRLLVRCLVIPTSESKSLSFLIFRAET
jgi:hypothetical protein